MRSLAFSLVWLFVVGTALAASPRYFSAWSYTENSAAGEIPPDEIAQRELGYWALEFNEDGEVLGGTYHGAGGRVWLSLRYVEEKDRIYADLFGPGGDLLTRKSTQLRNLSPRIER